MNTLDTNLRRTLQIALLICVLADVALVALYLSPLVPSRREAAARLSSTRAQVARLQQRVDRIQALVLHLRESRLQTHGLIARSFPDERVVYSMVLSEINRISVHGHVLASDTTFDTARNSVAGLRRVNIASRVSGDYGSLIEFLNQLERSPVFFIIDQISLTRADEIGGSTIHLEIKFETYAQSLAPPAPELGQASTS